jgi:gliding motility-associated-like protein
MKKNLLLTFLMVQTIFASLFAQDFSNKGKDFWIGYGNHVRMFNAGAAERMQLYITSDVSTTGIVEIAGVAGFPQSFTVTANQITTIDIPRAAALLDEGTYNFGIHVTSARPVVVYSFIYVNAISGATVCLPTNTLGKSYTSVNYTQVSNEPNSYSYFFVIATEDNTSVEIIPAALTKSGKPSGVPYTVVLNKGQIHQVLSDQDLTGSSIKSLSAGANGCEKIAVYCGSGKISIGCGAPGSSDNLYQQMYPTATWGKKYITVPARTRNGIGTQTTLTNFYRVISPDPSANIQVNGVVIPFASFTNGFYYEFSNNTPNVIISDKPILVAQYFTTQNCSGNPAPGDPDMIYLNPVEQTIDKVTLNSLQPATGTAITEHFLNIVVKNSPGAINSFKIDGANFAAFSSVPNDPDFSYAQVNVLRGTHTITCDTPFNIIAYGFGNAESYGYSGGTNLRDLYQFVTVQNQFATVNFPAACKNSPFKFSMTFPYAPTEIKWIFGPALNALGINDTTITAPVADSTYVLDGRTLRLYRLNRFNIISVPGTYPIKVRALNPLGDGCNNDQEIDYDLEVFAPPVADFGWFSTGCLTDSVAFFDQSPISGRPIVAWWYGYDDGGSNTISNPKHKFLTPGPHEIKYVIRTDVGCFSDTIPKTINLSPLPEAKFSPSATLCVNGPVTFTDISIPNGATLVKWYWDFGDGTTLVALNGNPQTHTYATTGPKTVRLIVESNTGCKSIQFNQIITINARPFANFTLPDVCLPIGAAQFTSTSTINDGTQALLTYNWTFGDGVGTGTGANPLYNYSATGPFDVTLLVTSNNGCTKDTIKQINTIYARPTAGITSNLETCLTDSLAFTDNSNGQGRPVTQWFWDFGDGNMSNLRNPKHKYLAPGPYTVTLYIKTDKGCISDTATQPITVLQRPTADFNIGTACDGKPVTFTDASNPFNAGNIVEWKWNLGDGTTLTRNSGAPFTHTYALAGPYTVTLEIKTDKGCSSIVFSKPITVNAKPKPDFTLPGICLPSGAAQFDNLTTITDGTIATVTYAWNFGDGVGTSIQPTPLYIYSGTGPYPVTLTATSANGCEDAITKSLNTIYAQPIAAFNANPEVCLSDSLAFTDISSGTGQVITQWAWNFGDGNTSILQNPKHKYLAPGPYTVTLTVRSDKGCPSTVATRPVTVLQLPTAGFTVSAQPCEKKAIIFTSNSIPNAGSLVKWTWDFGDGTTQTFANGTPVTHTYGAPGDYTVTLVVETDKGCKSTLFPQIVSVKAKPTVDFTLPNVCLPVGLASFTQLATISDGSQASFVYAWTFGDGGTGTGPTPTHNYSSVGPFDVKLSVTSNNGCIGDTTKQLTTIFPEPLAVFTPSVPEVCLGGPVTFTSTSTATRPIVEWNWNFGDGNGQILTAGTPVTHTYLTASTFTPTLQVKTDVGCLSNLANQTVIVNPLPAPAFNVSLPNCENQAIIFTDISTPGAGNIVKWNWNLGDGTIPVQTSAAPFTHIYTPTGTYPVTLTVETNKGCISATPALRNVVINPLPVVKPILPEICLDDPFAQFDEASTIADGTESQFTYLWNFGDPNATPGNPNTSTLKNPRHAYSAARNYTVGLTITSGNNCSVQKDTTFTVNGRTPKAHYSIVGSTLCSNKDMVLRNESFVQDFGSVIKLEIFWDFNNNPTDKTVDELPTVGKLYNHKYPEFGAPLTKTYRVHIIAYSGSQCFDEFDSTITISASPKITFNTLGEICEEIPTLRINQATELFGLVGTGAYSGTGVTSSGIFTPATAGVGTHIITYRFNAANGCSAEESQPITVNPTPDADAGPDRVMLEGGSVVLLGVGSGNGLDFTWTPNVRIDNDKIPQPRVTPNDDIFYKLTVTSDKGCIDEDEVFVKLLKKPLVPNAFSPNGDGINDTWVIEYLETYPGAVVEVFNRNGQVVFRSPNGGYTKPWDGTVNGKALPSGTYYYIINPKNGRSQLTGYVVIVR